MPLSFQIGAASLVVAIGAVRLLRALDSLRRKTSDSRPPTPPKLAAANGGHDLSRCDRSVLLRELIAVPLVTLPLALAIGFSGRLPAMSRRLDVALTGSVHPAGWEGLERSLDRLSKIDPAVPVGGSESEGNGSAAPGGERRSIWAALSVVVLLAGPLAAIVALLLGGGLAGRGRGVAAAAGSLLAIIGFAGAGVAAGEISGSRHRIEYVDAFTRLPLATPGDIGSLEASVKLRGEALPAREDADSVIHRHRQVTSRSGEVNLVEETDPFSVGGVYVAADAAGAVEVFGGPEHDGIHAGAEVLVLGTARGGNIIGSIEAPLVVASAAYDELFLSLALSDGSAGLHRGLTMVGQLACLMATLVLLAWAILAPSNGENQPR